MSTTVTLTVHFDAPFWVGVLEIAEAGEVRATRHVFGGEPTDAELHLFLLRHGSALLARARANPAVPEDARRPRRANPKRAMRQAAREAARVEEGRHSTASQEALRREAEERKSSSAAAARQRRQDEDERRYALARAKRRQRRRGH